MYTCFIYRKHKGNKKASSDAESVIDQFASILNHATVLPYHVLSAVLYNPRNSLTVPAHRATSTYLLPPGASEPSAEHIEAHPAYRSLLALDDAALRRIEDKHPVLGPIIDNINSARSSAANSRNNSKNNSKKNSSNFDEEVDVVLDESDASASSSSSESSSANSSCSTSPSSSPCPSPLPSPSSSPARLSVRTSRSVLSPSLLDWVTLPNGDVYKGTALSEVGPPMIERT
jgi:hypothetical protein